MTKPSSKLAESLKVLKDLQNKGIIAITSGDMTRTHRERLLRNGFLQPVMKGWYIPARPDETAGESTAWYASFWDFCAAYLTGRFGKNWSLSPEQSLLLHAGNRRVPDQLLVRATKSRNQVTELLHGISLLEVRANLPAEKDTDVQGTLRLFSLPAALIACSPNFFRQNPTDARTVLAMIRDASEVLNSLLEGGHSTIAGRLAGAFRNIGSDRIADNILKTMQAAGYDVRESDPFENKSPVTFTAREHSPYVNRLRLMWESMRGPVLEEFPSPPGLPKDAKAYLITVNDVFVMDAYHSLSIEGYRVSPDLIERVRKGRWNPDTNAADREQRDALAARGYWLAFQAVQESLKRILKGENPADVADEDHGTWYREMFAPGVTAGLLRASDLAGYRNGQVYIRRSMHVPPSHEAVRDIMPAFFDLLRNETEPAVRAILGHFVFVYIHPYMDGNGRMGRFLMNMMLAAAGWNWTVIPVEKRDVYMGALESASVRQEIRPFVKFLESLIKK
ncbi:MAG: Fic family protein [Nitrospira sp.]|nr:Fic family protein [Nitrospira sp.]